MYRKLLVLASIGIILVVSLFSVRYIMGRSSGQGVLKVTANITSKVLLENKDIGKTPLEQKIDIGEYSIRIVPEGTDANISSWQGNVKIGSNVLTYVNRDLSESELTSSGETLWLEKIGSTKGELTVTSVPDGGNVTVDDESKGITPLTLTELSEGDHTLLVSSPGFEPRTIKIKVTSGYKLTASLSLALSPGQMLVDSMEEPVASSSAVITQTIPTPTPTPTTIVKSPTPTKKIPVTPSPTKSTSVAVAKKIEILDTPTGFLRVREEPSTAASEVGRVKPGDQFSVLDSKLVSGVTWHKIAYTETEDGWISGQYAKKIE